MCSLYSTLEHGGVDRRYYLSKRACQGILNRANAHHKDLPPELEKALHSAIDNSNTCDDSPSDSDDEDDDMDDSSDDDSDTNDYDDGSENGSDMNSEPNQSTPDEASHTDCKNSQVVSFMTGHTKSLGSGISYADKSYTLSCANDTAVAIPINMRDALRNPTPNDNIRGKGWNKDGEPSYTITTELHPGVVTFEPHWAEYDGSHISESNVASTLRCNPGSNRLAVAYEEKKGDGDLSFYAMNQHQNPQPADTCTLTCKNCSSVRGNTPLVREKVFGVGSDQTRASINENLMPTLMARHTAYVIYGNKNES